MGVRRAILVLLATATVVHALPVIPPEFKDGQVVLAYQGGCTNRAPVCASFMTAVWAWEQRAVLVDGTPGLANRSASPPPFTVGWELRDSNLQASAAVVNTAKAFILRDPPAHAEVSSSGSLMAVPSAQLTHGTHNVIMGCASGANMADRDQFAYYMRGLPPSTSTTIGVAVLADMFNVTNLLALVHDEPFNAGLYAYMRDKIPAHISLEGEVFAHQAGVFDPAKWMPGMMRVAGRRERYLVAFFYAHLPQWIPVAKAAGLFSKDRQWLGTGGLVWTNIDYSHINFAVGVEAHTAGPLFAAWKEWGTGLNASDYPQFFKSTAPPISNKFFKYKIKAPLEPCVVDSVFTTLFAIERLYAAGVPLSECKGAALLAEMYRSDFEGVGGRVKFDALGDREGLDDVYNIINGKKVKRGLWKAGKPMVIGGWEGNLMSPDYAPLLFTNGSKVPLAGMLAGCPKGQRYMGFEEGCAPCANGTFNPLDDNVENTCIPCEAGMHAPEEGLSVCVVCPVGNFQSAPGQSVCEPCVAGLFTDEVGQSLCEPCIAGTYSTHGATHCTHCDIGSFAPTSASTGCQQCPLGFTTEFVGSIDMDACACPASSLFIPQAAGGSGNSSNGGVAGSCFRCNDPVQKGVFDDGLFCPGGRACQALSNRTVLRGIPCPKLESDCLDVDGAGCAKRCIVPLARAQEICESFEFRDLCHGWSIKTSALVHSDLVRSGSLYGWANVAELGQIADDANGATVYGVPASGFSLVVARRFCSPVASSDSSFLVRSHAKHTVSSFLQPPVVRAGHYMPDLDAVQRALLPNSRSVVNAIAPAISLAEEGREPEPWASSYFQLLPLDPEAPVESHPGPVPLFKCSSPGLCPGGLPGQCFPGQIDLNCGRCVKGFYSSSTEGCLQCTGQDITGVVFLVFALAGFVAIVILYKMTLDPLGAQVSAKMATGLALGLTFNALQTLGVMSLMTIDFPEPLASLLSSFRLVLFDIDQLQWECVVDVTPLGKLSARLLAPVIAVAMYQVVFIASRILHRIVPAYVAPFTVAHTLNCTGMVLQLLFISICMGVIMPFKCSPQPVGGLSTLVDITYQACGLGDHNTMTALGTVFIFVYPVFGMASCTYVIYILPRKTAQDPTFLNYFRFLVSRFRFDRYYFGLLFMLRNLGIALVPVLNPSNPMLQQIAMCSLLLVALLAQALLWPWAALEVNLLDLGCLVAMILTAVLSAGMVDSRTVDTSSLALAGAWIVAIAFLMMGAVVAHGIAKALATVCTKKGMFPVLAEKLQRKAANKAAIDDLVTHVVSVAAVLHPWNRRHVHAFIEMLPLYDRAAVGKACGILLGAMEGELHSSGGSRGTSTQMRITVNRYKRRSSMFTGSAMENLQNRELAAAMEDVCV